MEQTKKILLVEDDDTIAFGIKAFLEKSNFSVKCSDSIETSKDAFQTEEFDLILLDLNLPDGNGFDFCAYAKSEADIPVIFLTVRNEESDIVKGLDMGADDYVVKPFQFPVLLSRINAVLRRTVSQPSKSVLSCGNVVLDKNKTQAFCNRAPISLTAGEYRLLLMLLENKNQTLTRNTLLGKLWDVNEAFVNDNTLTVTMKRLREKLGNPSFIQTIRGIGYRVEDYDE